MIGTLKFWAAALWIVSAFSAGCTGSRVTGYDIPWGELSSHWQQKLAEVLERVHLRAELKKPRVKSTVSVYDFLLDRLPLTAALVRELNLASYLITQKAPGVFMVDDQAGIKVIVHQVWKGHGKRIYYTTGKYVAPIIPTVRGRGVIIQLYRQRDGYMDNRALLFFSIDSKFYQALTALFKPIVRSVMLEKSTLFIIAATEIAERICRNPERVYRLLKKIKGVTGQDVRDFENVMRKLGGASRRNCSHLGSATCGAAKHWRSREAHSQNRQAAVSLRFSGSFARDSGHTT
jgi:hypothetical protein